METASKNRDVFTHVTKHIIGHLEKGIIPWKKLWTDAGLPRNLLTGRLYRGVNVWLLNALNYEENVFLTYNQVKSIGGRIRAGEKAHTVILWQWIQAPKPKNAQSEARKIPLVKYCQLFNISQCADIPDWYLPGPQLSKLDPLGVCDAIVTTMPNAPEVRYMGDEAYYHSFFDIVNMPSMARFVDTETYYTSLFHQLVHSTGHKTRLNRRELDGMLPDKIGECSLEELTAEIGACYLCSYAGIDGWEFRNRITYIENWITKLNKDKRLFVYASTQAQHAVDYILNLQGDTAGNKVTASGSLQPVTI